MFSEFGRFSTYLLKYNGFKQLLPLQQRFSHAARQPLNIPPEQGFCKRKSINNSFNFHSVPEAYHLCKFGVEISHAKQQKSKQNE
jgi:hypothetical protein